MSEKKFTFEVYDGIAYDVLKDGKEWIKVSDQDDAETLCTFLNEQQDTYTTTKPNGEYLWKLMN